MKKSKEYRPSDIVLVRHGQSVWNAVPKNGDMPLELQGVPDHRTPLTDLGRLQATQTGEALFKEFGRFDVIYYSPYLRTAETARYIAAGMPSDVPMFRDLCLIEQQFGRLDTGVALDKEELARLRQEFEARKKLVGKFYAVPPDGESWFRVCLRTHDFLGKLFRPEWNDKKILVVSHAVTTATFLYHLHGREEEAAVEYYEKHSLNNCGIAHFRHNLEAPLHWELVCWNKVLWKAD